MNDIKLLNDKELNLVQTICDIFKERYTGKTSAAKTEEILFHLKATGTVSLSPQTLRKIIGHIRNNDLLAPFFILSNVNSGYWLSSVESELNAFLNQELDRMSNQYTNIQLLHQRIRNGKKKTENNQQQLF